MGKSKKNKNKSFKVSKRTISIFCALVSLMVVAGGLIVWLSIGGKSLFNKGDMTVDALRQNSINAMQAYEYALMTLTVEEAYTGGEDNTQQYILSSHRGQHEKSYIYVDSLGTSLYQCWEPNGDVYDVYIHDDKFDVWVKTQLNYEPVTNDPWSMLSDIGEYTLQPETQNWYWSDDECYVLEMVGESPEYPTMYEQLFIRKSDFIPIGIISYAASSTGEVTDIGDIVSGDFDNNGVKEEAVVDSAEVIHSLMNVYELSFSNSDMRMFTAPERYITESEYMELINAGGNGDEQ